MNKKTIISALVCSAILFSSTANAYFNVEEDVAPPGPTPAQVAELNKAKADLARMKIEKRMAEQASYKERVADAITQGSISQFGAGFAAPVKGAAEDISVANSLLLITPTGWRADVEQEAKSRKSSWTAADGESWVSVLDQVAKSSGVSFIVDWGKKLITGKVSGVTQVLATAHPNTNTAHPNTNTAHTSHVKTSPAPVVARAPAPKVKPFVVTDGETLSEVTTRWAKRAGWTVDWALPGDFRLKASGQFTADLNSSIEGLLTSLNESTGAHIQAGFYSGNRVVRIYQEK